ncbi:MAG TPA: DUF4129 domain-containing protein [Solirubrobacteraceae bacterium]|nr:DUF4129 domain-containing protein [Solirubrobacteraceae bacterium]
MRRGAAVLACALACAAWPEAARGAEPTAPDRSAPASVSAERAREEAREILAQRRFQLTNVPAPLRGLRERVVDALRSLGRRFEDAFGWVAGWFPGGSIVGAALLAALVLAAAALLAARAGARRAAAGARAERHAAGGERRPSAARLRQEAERAERRGDLDEALRLRFGAGLAELDQRRLIELRPALTNRELLRAVPSPTLAGLVEDFEAVAYGGRPAAPDDLREARDGWPRVPQEASAR